MIALCSLLVVLANDPPEAVSFSGPADATAKLLPLTEEEEEATEAWERLGDVLADAGSDALAVLAWERALSSNPDSDRAARALDAADRIGDVAPIALAIQDRAEAPGDGDARSTNAVRVARELLRDDQLSRALAWLRRVDADSPAFADAESLRGIVLAQQGKHTDALAPLQTARALGKTLKKGQVFDDKLTINLARVYYADKNFGQAIYHYSLIPRNSIYWPEARFEKAWAHFRADDLPGTIGELQTHASPFFDALWFPEAWMLRAQAMFAMCRFGAAIDAMEAFETRYGPVLEQLNAALDTLDPQSTWEATLHYLDDQPQPLPEMVLRSFRYEDRLAEARRAVQAYEEAAEQAASWGEEAEPLARMALERARAIRTEEGGRILARVRRQRDELADMSTGLELARVEILNREANLYQRAALTGELQSFDRKAELKKIAREKKGYRIWPFQGEYWLDELGWYTVRATSLCPENQGR